MTDDPIRRSKTMIGKENLFGRLWHRIGCMYLMGLHYTPTEVPSVRRKSKSIYRSVWEKANAGAYSAFVA